MVRIYSPELISAQKELFEAIRSKEVFPQLYTATRNKLKLWKLSDKQMNAIEKRGTIQEQVDMYSDYSGYVVKRNVEPRRCNGPTEGCQGVDLLVGLCVRDQHPQFSSGASSQDPEAFTG